MRFEFFTHTRILFGPGTVREVPAAAAAWGRRALLVTGNNPQRAAPLRAALQTEAVECVPLSVPGEPTTDLIQVGAALARAEHCELVIAMGGGSVLDAGKAVAALAVNPGELHDYLEVIGRGLPLACAPLPCIAIPTTAGTGTEVTRNAVLVSPAHRVKASLRSPSLPPRMAVVDPELTLGLPRSLTASTGLDALTQLIEPFVSCRANPLVDALCRDGLVRVARSLRRAADRPDDLPAREDMAFASLLSGLALANAGLGAVHGFAAPIGGRFSAPHGAVCAALLPWVMAANLRALQARQPDAPALVRYGEIARLLTGQADATAADGVHWVKELCACLAIAPLGRYGLTPQDLPDLIEHSARASSMKGNPLPLTAEELREILEQAL